MTTTLGMDLNGNLGSIRKLQLHILYTKTLNNLIGLELE